MDFYIACTLFPSEHITFLLHFFPTLDMLYAHLIVNLHVLVVYILVYTSVGCNIFE